VHESAVLAVDMGAKGRLSSLVRALFPALLPGFAHSQKGRKRSASTLGSDSAKVATTAPGSLIYEDCHAGSAQHGVT
jgi:hypothetical protein